MTRVEHLAEGVTLWVTIYALCLVDTHHGHYAVLCEWLCPCPEAWPL